MYSRRWPGRIINTNESTDTSRWGPHDTPWARPWPWGLQERLMVLTRAHHEQKIQPMRLVDFSLFLHLPLSIFVAVRTTRWILKYPVRFCDVSNSVENVRSLKSKIKIKIRNKNKNYDSDQFNMRDTFVMHFYYILLLITLVSIKIHCSLQENNREDRCMIKNDASFARRDRYMNARHK